MLCNLYIFRENFYSSDHIAIINELFMTEKEGEVPAIHAYENVKDSCEERGLPTVTEQMFGTLVNDVFSGQRYKSRKKFVRSSSSSV